MRTNLILHFHCNECGAVLSLVNRSDHAADPEQYRSGEISPNSHHTPEPTGGVCRHVEPIMIEPCRQCIEKHTAPAKNLVEAVRQMVNKPAGD